MELRPVKIYTTNNSPRLKYIADLILKEILGLSWEIITDRRKLGKFPVINYSREEVTGSCKISPSGLLFETGLRDQEIEISYWNGLPAFFQTTSDSDIPFDIFAASFYLVTRYEEYLDFEPDEFGRFRASDSIATKHGFLNIPVVDLWTKELAKALLRRYHTMAFKRNNYKALVTIDVDEPFAYLGRSLVGYLGDFLHDFRAKTGQAAHRFGCLTRGEKDPYEVFNYISSNIALNDAECIYFFPVGDHSEYDKNPSWKNDEYKHLINSTGNKSSIGIHPSFKASVECSSLGKELKRLRKITGKEISKCRFHFLRIAMPRSYNNITEAGITEDYSMGYPDEPGFRAGIARPFYFYNVAEDRLTGLRIIPFQIMDITLLGYKKINTNESKETIRNMILATRNAGGQFVSIWHNTTLLDTPECFEWREVFDFTLKGAML